MDSTKILPVRNLIYIVNVIILWAQIAMHDVDVDFFKFATFMQQFP